MEGGDVLTITVLVLTHLISGNSAILPPLYFNSNGVSWDAAAKECGQYGLENDQHVLSSISELEGKILWIGEKVYHVTLPWIEILGCFAVHNISSTHHTTSLGQCQRQCMVSAYFGYKDETRECVCLRDRGHNSSFDSCSNRDMRNSFFVYSNFSASSEPADGKNCMTSSCKSVGYVQFVKEYCNSTASSIKGVCEDGSPATTVSSPQFWGKNKSVIMERCGGKHKLLPSSTFCNSSNPVWTSVFRVEEDFEIETGIYEAGDYNPIGCVAATLNNSVLHKTHKSCDATVKYFVCKQIEPTTPDITDSTKFKPSATITTGFSFTITSTPIHPTVEKNRTERPLNLKSTTKKNKNYQTSSGNHIETTSKQYSENGTMGVGQKIADKTSPVGAIAGGIVGFLVLVSLTVISLIICRRRQVCMFQHKKNPSNMSNTYADIPNTTSNSLKRSTDADVNGSNIVNNKIYSGNFHADLVYSKEGEHQKSNNIDTDSPLDLDCYDHLNAHSKRETMLNENLYSSNVVPRSNTDPTYDYSTTGTTHKRYANSIYDHTLESMNSRNVGFRNNTDPTYDYSTMCTIQGKDTNNIYDHTVKNMESTCSNIDSVYAVSRKFKPAK